MAADASSSRRVERSVRLYPWYQFAYGSMAWLPVYLLYLLEYVSLAQVIQLEAAYYLLVVLLEVPSGYFSDVVGRRVTLLISASAYVGANAVFLVVGAFDGFSLLLLAQALRAVGSSFNSGTDASFHYDLLYSLNRADEYASREAVAARNAFLANALAALAGGLLGAIDLRLAFALSLLASAGSLAIVWCCAEPPKHAATEAAGVGFADQLRRCLGYLRRAKLAWLFCFAVLMIVINHIPYEYYQPYIALLGERSRLPQASQPVIAGVHVFITMWISAWFAAASIRLRNRFGVTAVLLSATLLQVLMMVLMGLWLSHVVLWLVVLRSTPRALMTAPLNAAITPMIDQRQRATYLSIQSLAGRLTLALMLGSLSLVSGSADPIEQIEGISWSSLSRALLISAAVGLAGFLALFVTARRLREPAADALVKPQ